jgi:hypothetical protein
MSEYFKDDYSFLDKPSYQMLKPNEDLICCKDLMLNVLGNKIASNFIEPIQLLYDHYKNDYYKKLLDIVKNKQISLPLQTNNELLDTDIKEIILRFIESSLNYKLLISFEKLDVLCDISYELNNLTKNQLLGIVFQIDIQKNIINKNYKYYENYLNDFNGILYCYYVKNIEVNVNNGFIIDDFNGILEISQVIFNDLSLEVLNYCRIDRIIQNKTYDTFFNHLIYKRFLYYKVKTIDQIRFMLFSCSILFSLGTTVCQDIDLLVYHEHLTDEMKYLIDTYFVKEKFSLIDLHIKGYGEWKDEGKKNYLDDWFLHEWPNLYGSKDMETTFFDPRYHYYFMGIKIISYKADIMRRVKRNRATAYTDLIMLGYFNGLIIKPFQLTRDYWQNNQQYFYSDNDLKILIEKVLKNIIRWHNIKLSASRVYNYIIFPDDFKLNGFEIKKIDENINKWIKHAKQHIFNESNNSVYLENMHKIDLIIEPLQK